MVNLKELQVFLIAAEHENFSEAARRLHLSQPAVSLTIANLEKQFKVQLFARAGRSYRLTEAGKVLQAMAKELLASASRLQETMLSFQAEVIGQFVIGCSTASGKYLLPGLIADFRKQYPGVRADVLVSSRNSVFKRLLEGDIAFGVSSKLIEHSDLDYQEFFTDEIILVVSKGHRWAKFRKIFPDDLSDEPLILREEASGTREVVIEGLRQHGISQDMLKVAMVLGNAEAICMAVERQIGIAFTSRLAAARNLEAGSLIEVEVADLNLRRKIYMARNLRIPATRAQNAFWDHVLQHPPQWHDPNPQTLVQDG